MLHQNYPTNYNHCLLSMLFKFQITKYFELHAEWFSVCNFSCTQLISIEHHQMVVQLFYSWNSCIGASQDFLSPVTPAQQLPQSHKLASIQTTSFIVRHDGYPTCAQEDCHYGTWEKVHYLLFCMGTYIYTCISINIYSPTLEHLKHHQWPPTPLGTEWLSQSSLWGQTCSGLQRAPSRPVFCKQ